MLLLLLLLLRRRRRHRGVRKVVRKRLLRHVGVYEGRLVVEVPLVLHKLHAMVLRQLAVRWRRAVAAALGRRAAAR